MSDVIVIGGGPAGSTVAALVAEAGHNVQLFERENFPRFSIGESLMPDTYWTFKRLGVLDKLKASAFPRKHSVQFFGKLFEVGLRNSGHWVLATAAGTMGMGFGESCLRNVST